MIVYKDNSSPLIIAAGMSNCIDNVANKNTKQNL